MEGKTAQLPRRCGYGTKFDWQEAHYKPQDCSSGITAQVENQISALRSEGLSCMNYHLRLVFLACSGGGLIVFVFFLMLDDVLKGGKDKE